MNDIDFKLSVTKDIAELKTGVKYLVDNMPQCEKEVLKNDIAMNRRILFILLVAFIGMSGFLYREDYKANHKIVVQKAK